MIYFHLNHMYDDEKLSASHRGYKVSGEKLKPRSAYEASLGGSSRERRREYAKQLKHMLAYDNSIAVNMYRAGNHLPARVRRMMETLVRETDYKDNQKNREILDASVQMLLERAGNRHARYWKLLWEDRIRSEIRSFQDMERY